MSDKFNRAEWEACLKVLTALKDNPFDNPDNQQLKTLITSIYKKAKKQNKNEVRSQKKASDFALLKNTRIVSNALNKTTEFAPVEKGATETQSLLIARKCYSCDKSYSELHFFYHSLCPDCANLNYGFRRQKNDFSGYNVIITGGRVKIGYATALKFLRSGARVILTTRFPALALQQLQMEDDYDQWSDKVTVYGLDLRNLRTVQEFIGFCNQSLKSVDILVNNAAQTIKYPVDYYQPLIAKENKLLLTTSGNKLVPNHTPLVFQQDYLLPEHVKSELSLNRFGQPIDYREKNSWNSTLTEIPLEELLEVNLINHISPYLLISGLRDAMLKSHHTERFIINVSSSEGQFSYSNKTIFHPHTNMTKAALNMLTRTSAADFVKDHIYMTAVDVGWISTGAHETKRAQQFDDLKIPPLDPLDGAMRIVHPIDEVLKGNKSIYGVLLKDYKITAW